jgi:FMN phosphatase YigB (HAD superfamily)
MMYFLDFDRTLFDTDAYNRSLIDEPGCAPFKEDLEKVLAEGRDDTLTPAPERARVWGLLSEAMRSGALTFAPGYLSRFLYADVAETFRGLGNEAVLITYGEVERQRIKIESALADVVRLTVLYTGELAKADFLKTWPGYYGAPAIFVDDRVAEL